MNLTVTNLVGSSSLLRADYITVNALPTTPVADFAGVPTSGTAPLTVTFTDNSTNSPTSWNWSFGDGATSGTRNPVHTYTTAGTYTVSLNATNAGGSIPKPLQVISLSMHLPLLRQYPLPILPEHRRLDMHH